MIVQINHIQKTTVMANILDSIALEARAKVKVM